MGNGARVAALAIGVYDLTLPSVLVFQLKNCYYVPVVCRNIILVSCLDVDGFHFIIKNNIFSIYNADIFYGNVIYLMVSTFKSWNNPSPSITSILRGSSPMT